jgi:nitrite reductase/ring-hydroxylating ferredoxin subunit
MDAPNTEFALACSLDELRAKGRLVVHGGHRPILVVCDRGRIFALDNRCPHMGFPLDRGSIEDGILTCHWHHARFDLESGCTFDLWADDAPTCAVEVRNGEVWVKTSFGFADPASPGVGGSMMALRMTSASSSPKPCKANSGPVFRRPTSFGRLRSSAHKTATAGAWA